ncbi:hypothetical protein PRUPE_7G209700 [Prunus persica]|uniref:Uncharacterized protein n=1 Tax=Prunus persica TaxID=3760 RepID=M5VWF8_PRUPE|nr:uncharacterized protein LOC18769031 [Prunus persica]ONH97780.1 hypothetical protein PRUPE_7G209700 [Prunus persica]
MADTDRGTLKRPGDEALEEKAVKRQRDLEVEGDQNDDILTLLFNEPDETLDEVMKLLDAADNGASCTTGAKVRFVNDPYSPSSYFTVNGNEESCGSSFSELESTCMVGVDICGGGLGIGAEVMGLEFDMWLMEEAKEENGGACGVIEEEARGGGWDMEAEWDDAALARFIGEDLF